jgi:hypothetical protein
MSCFSLPTMVTGASPVIAPVTRSRVVARDREQRKHIGGNQHGTGVPESVQIIGFSAHNAPVMAAGAAGRG